MSCVNSLSKKFELLSTAESERTERWILQLTKKLGDFPYFQSAPFFADNTLFCDVTFSENSRCEVKKQMNRIIELSRNFDNLLRNWEIITQLTEKFQFDWFSKVNKSWIIAQTCRSLLKITYSWSTVFFCTLDLFLHFSKDINQII